MKRKLFNAAIEDLVVLSRMGRDCMDWVVEMHGALLVSVGSERKRLLANAEPDERTRIMQEIADNGKLDFGGLENIVFVFGGDLYPEAFLHASRDGENWRLRLALSTKKGFAFCPVLGVLDRGCTGMGVEKWLLGGEPESDPSASAFHLFDCALTAFSRLHGYSQRMLHHRSETLNLMNTGLAAAA